ncbi:MAG: ImmA/IrrE family metallo-endopeptidase [Actinomycetes bacterium]
MTAARSFVDPDGGPAITLDHHGADVAAMELAAISVLQSVPAEVWDGTPPVPINWIVKELYGLHVMNHGDIASVVGVKLDEGKTMSGLLLPDRGVILVDEGELAKWPNRKRFTMAHELAHWILHRDAPPSKETPRATIISSDGVRNDDPLPLAEAEANAFAAALLLPAALFRPAFAACDGDFPTLIDEFASTNAALERRSKTLGVGAANSA